MIFFEKIFIQMKINDLSFIFNLMSYFFFQIIRGEVRVDRDFEVKLLFINFLLVKIIGGKWYIEIFGINFKFKVIFNR